MTMLVVLKGVDRTDIGVERECVIDVTELGMINGQYSGEPRFMMSRITLWKGIVHDVRGTVVEVCQILNDANITEVADVNDPE